MVAMTVADAAQQLEAGGLVAFPTETVYGLGADAENTQAVANIFALKGRPQNHPLIVHIASAEHLSHWAYEVPMFAHALIEKCWPGPLTLVLKKHKGVADACTGGQPTIGLRCPAHPMALALLRTFKQGRGGIAAPSANKFGKVSPTTAQHVRESFGDALPLLDGGACEVGIESTIIDCSRPELGAVLLRPGMVGVAELRAVLRDTPLILREQQSDAPPVSGDLPAHYQPDTPIRIIVNMAYYVRKDLYTNDSKSVLIAITQPAEIAKNQSVHLLSAEPARYAHDLYATLRKLDAQGFDEIVIEAPPDTPAWMAIHDRLKRAAYKPE
jgi:L-threonylcarbamoyladenylate synthase